MRSLPAGLCLRIVAPHAVMLSSLMHACMQVPACDLYAWSEALCCAAREELYHFEVPKQYVLMFACRQVPARHLRSWAKDEEGAHALFVYTHRWAITDTLSNLD